MNFLVAWSCLVLQVFANPSGEGANSSVHSTPTLHQVVRLVEGILLGVVDTEVPDLETCIEEQEMNTIGSLLVKATEKLDQEPDWKGAEDCIFDMGQSISYFGDAMQDCQLAENEVAEMLRVIGEEFSSPISFAYHVGKDLIVNGVPIYDDVKAAIADYHSDQWYEAGIEIGTAMSLAIFGPPDPLLLESTIASEQ